MRVIHILDHSIPHATAYAAHTVATLAAQRAQGWETFQLTGPNHGEGTSTEEQIAGWHFHRTPPPGGILEGVPGIAVLEFMGEIAHRAERLARRVRPHMLHAHSPVWNAVPALRVGRRLGIPVLYEVRPPDEGPLPGASIPRLPQWLTRALESWVLKRADAVTTASEASRSDLLVRGGSPAKIIIIAYTPVRAASRDAFDLRADEALLTGAGAYCRLYEQLMEAT